MIFVFLSSNLSKDICIALIVDIHVTIQVLNFTFNVIFSKNYFGIEMRYSMPHFNNHEK